MWCDSEDYGAVLVGFRGVCVVLQAFLSASPYRVMLEMDVLIVDTASSDFLRDSVMHDLPDSWVAGLAWRPSLQADPILAMMNLSRQQQVLQLEAFSQSWTGLSYCVPET